MQSVGSRVELERYIEDLQYAQGAALEHLTQLCEESASLCRSARDGAARRRLLDTLPAASASRLLLENANVAGSSIRANIEEMLQLYERAQAAREVVDQVIALRSALQGIHGAMEVRDWERAAILAHAALAVPDHVATSAFAQKMVPSADLPEDPQEGLRAACDDLSQLFLREFGNAARTRQMDQLTRYFKLFPLIGRSAQGLDAYAQFLCQIIAGLARSLLAPAAEATRQNAQFYGVAFTKLFENVASLLAQHSRLVAKHYGPHAMAQHVLPRVQQEIDKQAGLIIDTFWDERRIDLLLNRCRSYNFPLLLNSFGPTAGSGLREEENANSRASTPGAGEEDYDLQEASARLNELSTILNRWHLYTLFVQSRFVTPEEEKELESMRDTPMESGASIEGTQAGASNAATAMFKASLVAEKIRDLLGPTFPNLVLFVFRRGLERAVQFDELPTQAAIASRPQFSMEAPLASSLVDDVIYVFSSVLRQTCATYDIPTVEGALAGLRRVLESDLIGTLQRKLRKSAPSSAPSTSEFGGAGAFMVYLNDLELVSYYVGEVTAKIPPEEAEGTDLIRFRDSVGAKCRELMVDGCQTLASVRLASQARTIVTSTFKVSVYAAPTGTADSVNAGRSFDRQWKQFLRPLRQLLHPKVLSAVMEIVCRNTALALEQFVWSLDGRVTPAACLELEKDITHAVGACVEPAYTLRQRFTKLTQLVSALVEGPGAEAGALSPEEWARLTRFQFKN